MSSCPVSSVASGLHTAFLLPFTFPIASIYKSGESAKVRIAVSLAVFMVHIIFCPSVLESVSGLGLVTSDCQVLERNGAAVTEELNF